MLALFATLFSYEHSELENKKCPCGDSRRKTSSCLAPSPNAKIARLVVERFLHLEMAGIGVNSHQYFCSLRSKNIVWFLPGLAVACGDIAPAFNSRREQSSLFSPSPQPKRKPPCRAARFVCGDGGNRTRVRRVFQNSSTSLVCLIVLRALSIKQTKP